MTRTVALAFLVACAHVATDGPDAQGYRWIRDGATGQPFIHEGVDVYLECGDESHALSCSRIEAGRCDVYLPDDPAPWLIAHELKHCNGWRHPNPLGGFDA